MYQWMDLLAQERYAEALSLVDHDPKQGWTPELLKDVINGYGAPWSHVGGSIHKVTDRMAAEATETRAYEDVELYPQPLPLRRRNPAHVYIGHAWFDLPLDGTWSDLTATFDIVGTRDHAYLELDDVHVL